MALAPPPASAAQKVGCPSSEKWMQVTVELAAQRILRRPTTPGSQTSKPCTTSWSPSTTRIRTARFIDPVLSSERNPNSELTWFYLRDDNSNGG